eukprot:TRINITY_DN8670_c0_g1_i1.p1 TRINITY_DN8670_c0_g1~~TRINITY_DN8670_c0_g1_i1.p1  ORF type:complete len:392 (-),score=97.59 TRINITY_DN8670_c0_g1_i1:1167-2342(-)
MHLKKKYMSEQNGNHKQTNLLPQKRKTGENIDDRDMKKTKTSTDVLGPIIYEPCELLPDLELQVGSKIEVIILAKFLSLSNIQVKYNQFWLENENYTLDSDIVAILNHANLFPIKEYIPSNIYGVRVIMKIVSSDGEKYQLNKSRAYIEIESVNPINEEFNLKKVDTEALNFDFDYDIPKYPGTMIGFNLSNEPAYRYEFQLVCDRGIESDNWTSEKMKYHVLYIDTATNRYELCLGNSYGEDGSPTYRWSVVYKPRSMGKAKLSEIGQIPLPVEHICILKSGLDWTEIRWGTDNVVIGEDNYQIEYIYWVPKVGSTIVDEEVRKEEIEADADKEEEVEAEVEAEAEESENMIMETNEPTTTVMEVEPTIKKSPEELAQDITEQLNLSFSF